MAGHVRASATMSIRNEGNTMMHPERYCWDDMPLESIAPSIARRYITGDRVTIARFELAAGGLVPRHAHANEQVSCVLSGTLRFVFDSGEIVARSGDVVRIPGDAPHAVAVLEDAIVIDVFSPVRQDWVDKTDDYFRAPR
jgi:quercetin dioxygenase-like cupin family protein